VTSCKTMSKNYFVKESEFASFYGKINCFFMLRTLQSLGNFSHVVASRSSSKNARILNLQSISNHHNHI
jgi:hypothetical protein